MAVGWISLLSVVPWKEVISKAPAIADGAKKLWNTVTKKAPVENTSPFEIPASASTDAEIISRVLIKLNAVDATLSELQKQMLTSSELIQALAMQNTELIERVEANRIRLRWVSGFIFVLVIVVVALIKLALQST
ncbi:MAG: hypothetical protein Q8L73_05855 [Methylotenera sp.]|nr:hypothetical protein [Methylotenera sp.]